MENQFELFNHPKFGEIRVIILNNEPFRPWFVAVDVCRALDIKNSRDALSRLEDDEKQSIILPVGVSKNGVTNSVGSADGTNDAISGWIDNRVNIVNEPGIYRLIFSSRKKEALEFQRWVYHEVLPSIRKTGSYSVVAPAAKSKPAKNPNRVAGQKSPARVYVFKLIDGTVLIVKIGQSKDVDARKVAIERKTKLTVEKIYKTSLLPRNVARIIERASHKFFSPFRLNGEFFSADYDTACRFIDALEEVTTKLPQISYFERVEKLLQIANRLETLSENKIIEKSLLIKSAKLIADE